MPEFTFNGWVVLGAVALIAFVVGYVIAPNIRIYRVEKGDRVERD